ncbi:superoxide dismutase [Deinococcus sp. Arct2-2]|uniref:superoxide dismutase n=1 Tax=Deinococcus sp. Arct2-2 TaxID=2568653 RepID=UPI0010A3F680|nr:superoxide dismutase [Deinococcus sp. Arct2-2]THF68521.1 superoxide dismutase [Deinococcus sp. Arct2-2]
MSIDLPSGQVRPLVEPDGESALGVEVAGSLLLVAGASSGELRIYDRQTGKRVAVYDVTDAGLINDITVAAGTAYFTDSQRAVLYALPLHGRTTGTPREIPLSGDFRLAKPGEGVFNANGIVTLDANTLIVAQTNDPDGVGSVLYRVDVPSGKTTRIKIEGTDVVGADGLLLRGHTLWVVQHNVNSIAELRLSADGSTAQHIRTITDDHFVIPTTADLGPGGNLYVVSSHFFTKPSDDVPYEVVRTRP